MSISHEEEFKNYATAYLEGSQKHAPSNGPCPINRSAAQESVQAALVNLDTMEDGIFAILQRMRSDLRQLAQTL